MRKVATLVIFLVLVLKIAQGQGQKGVDDGKILNVAQLPIPKPMPMPMPMSMVDVDDGSVVVKKISVTTESSMFGESPLVFTRINCHKVILTMFNRIVDVIEGCADQVKKEHGAKGEYAKHFQCALKCSMKKNQMLDDQDLLTTESFKVFANEHLPKLIHPLLFHVMENCLQVHSRIIAASQNDDPQCLTYGNFLRCAKNYVTKNC